ncbi:probable membrane metalloprotease ARASP2, chloroplastic, partial [Tanacetum coccineum]
FSLGGFVGFPDNDPDSDIPVDDRNLLKNRPILDKVIVISAAVIANIIFAYVIIFAQIVFVGLTMQESFPRLIIPEVRPPVIGSEKTPPIRAQIEIKQI